MAEHIQQVKQSDGNIVAEETHITHDEAADQPASVVAARVVWFIAGVLIVLLAIRFFFILLGANQGNAFVDFIYGLTYPFTAPFFGIFSYSLRYGVAQVEVSTLIAMCIYALIAWGIARLLTIRQDTV